VVPQLTPRCQRAEWPSFGRAPAAWHCGGIGLAIFAAFQFAPAKVNIPARRCPAGAIRGEL
jgi:hypothetical protein